MVSPNCIKYALVSIKWQKRFYFIQIAEKKKIFHDALTNEQMLHVIEININFSSI